MRSYDQLCPVARTLDVIGERWSILIIRELIFGKTRFSEFQEQLPGIPVRILSDRLKKLEAFGVVERSVYSQHPLRAEYHLTEKGRSLSPVLKALLDWGMEHTLSPGQRAVVRRHVPAEIFAGD